MPATRKRRRGADAEAKAEETGGRTKRGRGDIIMGIESDSFTENVQPWHDFRVHTKRRRKFKRMAIGED